MPAVTIQPFGDTLEVAPGESVLAAILRNGRFVKYGCKHGGCGTCRAQMVSGDPVLDSRTAFALSDDDRDAGIVLLCSAYAKATDLVVDVSDTMDLTEDEFRAGENVQEFTCEVESIDVLTHDIRGLWLRLVDPPAMEFEAGQYADLEVFGGDDEWRAYSMANPPGERGRLYFIIKVFPDGRFSGRLDSELGPGDHLRVRGPLGQFSVKLSYRKMVMIAGGSGLGPIRAMLRDLVVKGNERLATFFYGARSDRDLCFHDEMTALAQAHEWLTYIPVLSEPENNAGDWGGDTGLVTEAVPRHLTGSLRAYDAYLCGPPGMIDAAMEVLAASGCKPRHIHFDRFVPSG